MKKVHKRAARNESKMFLRKCHFVLVIDFRIRLSFCSSQLLSVTCYTLIKAINTLNNIPTSQNNFPKWTILFWSPQPPPIVTSDSKLCIDY